MELRWTAGEADVRCPVCSRLQGQELLATTDVPWRDEPVEIVRCGGCGCVIINAVQPPSVYSDADWDLYVELIAGIEAIALMLSKVGAPPGARMLDVGCGYGFGLDIAQVIFKWEGIGLEPSLAAERGRLDLGLDIRSGTLDDAFEPDERFDVIFASEVLEHVPDPRDFLASVFRRLSDDGVFLMTTPDGSIVHPDTPMTVLYPALSIGAHEFLLSRDGLKDMLHDAGFEANVWVEGVTLVALAARSTEALRATRPRANVTTRDLIRYCETRGGAARPGSPLTVGMGSRRMKFAVSGNEFELAKTALPQLRSAVMDRYGIDLDDPSTTLVVADRHPVLVVVHYFVGIFELVQERDPRMAAAHFAAAGAVGRAQYEKHGFYPDPETPMLEFLAFGHLALARAQFDPNGVPDALAQMDETVAHGAGDPESAADYRARAEGEVIARQTVAGTNRVKARAVAARVYRRLSRVRVPGVARAARGVRGALVRGSATPGRPSSGRPASGEARGGDSPSG